MEPEAEASLLQPQPAQVAAHPAAVIDRLAIKHHAAGARLDDAADDVEKRALARAAGPEQPDDFAGMDGKAHLAQRVDPRLALAEMLGDAVELHQGRTGHRDGSADRKSTSLNSSH